jgi:hypothetical protein
MTRNRPIIRFLAMALFLAAVSSAHSSGTDVDKPQKISPKKLTQRIERLDPAVYYGGVMVAAGDTLAGPVVVIAGALDVQDGGVLDGDAWVVDGRLILTGAATVRGRVHLVDSEAFRSRVAEVTGGIERYRCECKIDPDVYEEQHEVTFVKYEDPMAIKTKPAVAVGAPTRVQYTVLRLGLKRENPRRPDPYVSGYAMADIPIWSSTRGHFGWDARVNVPLWGHRIGLVVRGYSKIISNDYWQVSRVENAFILVLTGWEFADYYQRQGGDLGLEFEFSEDLRLTVTGSLGRDYSLANCRTWSLFHSNDRLPPNPPIDDGDRATVAAAFVFDSRREPARPANAWYVELWGEKGFEADVGDFPYEAFSLDLRRYNSVPLELQLDLRGKLFSTLSDSPRQVYQSLNGYGGVRGLPDHSFDVRRGDRLALFTVELRRPLPEIRFVRSVFTSWDLLVFTDFGLLAEAEDPDDPFAFLDAPWDDWGKSVGLGVSGESILPYIGFYVAKDLDDRRGVRAILRIERSF